MSNRTRTALVSLLGLALLAWFLRGVDLADVWLRVRSARVDFLLLAILFVPLTYVTRAIRWQDPLAPIGPTRFRTALRTTVIGFAALAVLPARAGDVLRPYLLARQEGLSASATFATVVMERVLDLVAVLTLLAVYVWGMADRSALPDRLMTPIKASSALAGVAVVLLVVVMWVMATHPERIGARVFALSSVFPRRVAARLSTFASTFSAGFAAARHARGFLLAVLWSFPIWLVIGIEAWAVTRAFDIDMPLGGAFLLQALLGPGVAVPTPGGVGSFHEAYRIGTTTFFHASNDRAVAAALVLHLISFVPVVLVGVLFMAQDGLSLGRIKTMIGATATTGEVALR